MRTSSTCNYGERKPTPPDGTGEVEEVEKETGEKTENVTDVIVTTAEGPLLTTTAPDVEYVEGVLEVPDNETLLGNQSSVTSRSTSCISSCEHLPDGDYQSCFGCHIYALCKGGRLPYI